MRRIAAAALPVRCAVGMLLTTQRARLSMTAGADPFAKFASGLMRCNQKCFDRVADDLAGRGLPAGAAVLDLGASGGEPGREPGREPGGEPACAACAGGKRACAEDVPGEASGNAKPGPKMTLVGEPSLAADVAVPPAGDTGCLLLLLLLLKGRCAEAAASNGDAAAG